MGIFDTAAPEKLYRVRVTASGRYLRADMTVNGFTVLALPAKEIATRMPRAQAQALASVWWGVMGDKGVEIEEA